MTFWQRKSLEEMNTEEWESLCDGCGQCCLHKLEDEDTSEILYTRVACRFLQDDCSCPIYYERQKHVPECLNLKPEHVAQFEWLPPTCAYRLIYEGKPLYDWHPLISGDKGSVAQAGYSVAGLAISEEHVHEDGWDEHIIQWVQ